MSMLSVEQAKTLLLENFTTKSPVLMRLNDANGFVLAEDIHSPIDLPPFDNSSMDGFAVRSIDVSAASQSNPIALRVIEDIPAGRSPKKSLKKNQTSRIMTGAPLPKNADSVVPVEWSNFSDRYNEQILPESVEVYLASKSGENIRTKGMDVVAGEKLFSTGQQLKPHDLGFISGFGRDKIMIYPPPKIALFSSGNEIINAGKPLKPGQIYDINSISIMNLLKSFGAEVIDLGTAKDNYQKIKKLFDIAANLNVDMIVSTAGVSMGAYDYVKKVLEENGLLNFWKVNMRPGKPLTFGQYQGIPFLGLPGNPVSAYVGSRIFLKPVIRKILGLNIEEEFYETTLNEDIESDGRESYLRVLIKQIDGKSIASLSKHQGSGNMFSLVCANALLIVPAGVKSLPKGSNAKYITI